MSKKTSYITKIAMLSAIATILMLLEFPLPFIAPPFYELDFSEVPVLVGAFALGPLAGAVTEGIKILINFLINGSVTYGVGELANLVMGLVFVLPAALIYKKNKTKKGAVNGLIFGSVSTVILGCFINAYIMLPAYGNAFGWPISKFIDMAAKIWPVIDTMFEFMLLCVAPFNLIKVTLVSFIVIFIYKHISLLLHK